MPTQKRRAGPTPTQASHQAPARRAGAIGPQPRKTSISNGNGSHTSQTHGIEDTDNATRGR